MKILKTSVMMDLNPNSARGTIMKLAEGYDPNEVYFVVISPWHHDTGHYRDVDDKQRGGPAAFYLYRSYGWKTPWSWEVVMFSRHNHEPIAKIEQNPTN